MRSMISKTMIFFGLPKFDVFVEDLRLTPEILISGFI